MRKGISCYVKFAKKSSKKKRKTQKYCSASCQKEGLKKPLIVSVCQNPKCDNSFEHKNSDKRKYCSSSCSAQINNILSPKRQKEGKCKYCNAPCSASKSACDKCKEEAYKFSKMPSEYACQLKTCAKTFISSVPRKFCSKVCSNQHYKANLPKDLSRSRVCPSCGDLKSPLALICSPCAVQDRRKNKIESWLSGEWRGGNDRNLSSAVRNYLLAQANYACQECGFNTPHPSDGASILEVEHIDGDGSNHRPENLKILCPNCHALTPTYRARNMGNGRKTYYLRVDKSHLDNLPDGG